MNLPTNNSISYRIANYIQNPIRSNSNCLSQVVATTVSGILTVLTLGWVQTWSVSVLHRHGYTPINGTEAQQNPQLQRIQNTASNRFNPPAETPSRLFHKRKTQESPGDPTLAPTTPPASKEAQTVKTPTLNPAVMARKDFATKKQNLFDVLHIKPLEYLKESPYRFGLIWKENGKQELLNYLNDWLLPSSGGELRTNVLTLKQLVETDNVIEYFQEYENERKFEKRAQEIKNNPYKS